MRCIDDTLITAGIVYREAEAAPVNKKLRLEPFADLRVFACVRTGTGSHRFQATRDGKIESNESSGRLRDAAHLLERKRSGISNSILDCRTDSLHICHAVPRSQRGISRLLDGL